MSGVLIYILYCSHWQMDLKCYSMRYVRTGYMAGRREKKLNEHGTTTEEGILPGRREKELVPPMPGSPTIYSALNKAERD
jgi:hypothetical protein